MQSNPIKNNVSSHITAQQAQKVQRAQEAKQPGQEKPVEASRQSARFYQEPDQYIPQQPEEASGLYWTEPGEDGPKVNYSDPEKAPEKEVSNVTTTNTDDVDREIERARKKVEDLQSQLDRAQEGPQRERLERQLHQAQGELERKDNDTYRRQHAKIS